MNPASTGDRIEAGFSTLEDVCNQIRLVHPLKRQKKEAKRMGVPVLELQYAEFHIHHALLRVRKHI